jgi:ABC-type bacteriocin/lantibiotic exporter with double-glycine peptidase domain
MGTDMRTDTRSRAGTGSSTPAPAEGPQPTARAPRGGREVPFVAQLTPTDCGAAALASVLAFHEKHLPVHEVRALLGGGRNGVTARQLLTVARSFGFRARGVSVDPGKLRFLPRASIVHWDLAHYVVFERCDARGAWIVDPGVGRRLVPWADVSKSLSGVALLFEPGPEFVREKPPRRDRLRRYARWLFGVRDVWGRVLGASLLLQLLALSAPGLMGALVDKVVPRGDEQLLALIVCAFVSVASFFFLSTLLRARLLLHLRTKIEARMSLEFVEHLLALPYAFFQQRTTGDLMMRLSSQAGIRELLTTGTLSALLDGAMVTLYFVLLLGAAPPLALAAFVLASLQAVLYVLASRRNRRLVVEGLAAQSRLEGYQVEMLSGIETLKAMGGSDRATARWSDLYVEVLNRSLATGTLDGTFQALLGTLRFFGPVSLVLLGAHEVLTGALSLGTMLGLAALGAGFLDPVANLVGTAMKLTQLTGLMERIEDVLDTPPEQDAARAASGDRALVAGAIRLTDVGFRYPSEPRPTLEGVTLEIEPGECVAIVGSSGSGKSTLARLLARLYEPTEGTIAVDGIDLRQWSLPALRGRLGIVTQETRLFSGSIRDNVAMFEPEVSQEEVEGACALACLDEAIAAMPMGFDTVLADGGSSLSGGQRQRLSLARALVRRPDVLVLDEATSALDSVTEKRVQESLRSLRCTRVVVAHRLSTIIEADKIVVLEQGRVLAVGRHAELLVESPAYRELLRAQGGDLARPDVARPARLGPPIRPAVRAARSQTVPDEWMPTDVDALAGLKARLPTGFSR